MIRPSNPLTKTINLFLHLAAVGIYFLETPVSNNFFDYNNLQEFVISQGPIDKITNCSISLKRNIMLRVKTA